MRRLLLALTLALLVLPWPMPALAQADEPLSLVALTRSGDRLQVTMRANDELFNVVVKLTSGGAVAGLPDWQRDRWRNRELATTNFTLLQDVEVASLEWEAKKFAEETVSGAISIVVPRPGLNEPLSLVDVARQGDAVVVGMRANENLTDVVVRLTAGGAIAGLPEWRRAAWEQGERAQWSYDLLREIDRATLAWEARDAAGALRSGSLEVTIPAAAPEPAAPQPRLVVTSATLEGATVEVTVTNYGDAPARNVVVSIEDAAQKRIASPLTALIATLAAGARASPEFTLLQEETDVVVVLDHANETKRTALTLRKLDAPAANDTGELNVTLTTDLPFREVDLGRSADYAVQVRNGGPPSLVQLRVDGMPEGYSARFFVGGSAVPSLYLDHNQTRQATLTVTVPSDAGEVDRTVDFVVIASVNGTEAERMEMGIAVRGVGQLEVSSPDGEAPIPAGGQATFQVVIRNSGSAPVFNVELDSRRPYGWTVRVEPRRLDRIDAGSTAAVTVEVRAPDVIGGGRYTVDVAAKSGDITSRYTSLALNVDEPDQGGGWVWGVMFAIIAGILGFAGWWKWRG